MRAHAAASGVPTISAGSQSPCTNPDRIVARVAIAVDRREERDLGHRPDAGREQQQCDQREEVDRRRQRQRLEHRQPARGERARARRLDPAGQQSGQHAERDRRAEQAAVDQEALLHHLQRRARADERVALERAAAGVALEEHGSEVVDELVEHVQRRRVVALDQREHHEAQRRHEDEREQQQGEAARDERRKRRGPCHAGRG